MDRSSYWFNRPENYKLINELDLEQARVMVAGIDIPVRPTVLQKIMVLQERGDFDLTQIAPSVNPDVNLSAGVLQTVNFSLSGLKNKLNSLRQTVALLGMNNVMNLVVVYPCAWS